MSRLTASERDDRIAKLPRAEAGGDAAKPDARARVLNVVTRVTARVETSLAAIGWAGMFAMMMLVSIDVFMRYMFNSPVRWAFDFVSLYLFPVVFFLALTDTMRHNEHVAVDVVYLALPDIGKSICNVVIYAVATLVFAMFFYITARLTLHSFMRGEVLSGLIAWPVWATYVAAPIGTLPVTILCFARFVGALAVLVLGRPREDVI